jgi:hypothetical protein
MPAPLEHQFQDDSQQPLPPQELSDPYSLWAELPPGALLPYSQVLLGFASYLRGKYRPLWDEQTSLPTPWHLARDRGLQAWSLHEAQERLKERYQDAYTDEDFMVLHLAEDLLNRGADALKHPFWTSLFVKKQRTGDAAFFNYVATLLERKKKTPPGYQRLFTILFDRAYCPLEYWSSSAIAEFWRVCVPANTPSPELIRKWMERMKLKLADPPIVLAFSSRRITRLDKAAAKLHGLPDP